MTQEIILQWNTSSLIAHWGEFREYITDKKPLIAAIQETRFIDSDLSNYSLQPYGYSLYCDNVNDKPRKGGVALYISNNLLHHQVTFTPKLNYVSAQVKIAQQDITVVSLYISPSVNFPKEELDQLIAELPRPYIIMGDFNAQHTAWGCASNTTRGTELHDIINKHDTIFINDTTPTRHCVRNNEVTFSVIDLTLASPQMSTLFTSEVQSDRHFSDHYPIHLLLEAPSGQTNFFNLPRWSFKNTDWQAFQDHIDEHNEHNDTVNIDIREFLNTIYESASIHVKQTQTNTSHKHVVWWNEDCRRAVAIRRRSLRNFQKCICTRHEIEAREAQKRAKEIIKQAKQASWQSYASTFNRFTPLSKIWTMIKRFKLKRNETYRIPHLIINENNFSTPIEVATAFANHFANVSSHTQYSTQLQDTLNALLQQCNFNTDNTEHYNQPFTMYELRSVISKCGNTSVGPDQLHYQFFKKPIRNRL